jgi:hypothetical protein
VSAEFDQIEKNTIKAEATITNPQSSDTDLQDAINSLNNDNTQMDTLRDRLEQLSESVRNKQTADVNALTERHQNLLMKIFSVLESGENVQKARAKTSEALKKYADELQTIDIKFGIYSQMPIKSCDDANQDSADVNVSRKMTYIFNKSLIINV